MFVIPNGTSAPVLQLRFKVRCQPARLGDDYVPTGLKGFGMKAGAVNGHAFGLDLQGQDKKALIAFLKTL
jgi:hypothetical protein